MATNIGEGSILDVDGLARAARQLREDAGETQDRAAERIGKHQAQISRAEGGDPSHTSVCILLIEAYSEFVVECPLFRLRRDSPGENADSPE